MKRSNFCRAISAPFGVVGLRVVAELGVAAVHRLGRSAGDAEGDSAVGEQVELGGLLCQVKGVLVTQVDDAGTDLDVRGPGRGSGEDRHGCGVLRSEVVYAPVGPVHADLVGADGNVHGVPDVLFRAGHGASRGGAFGCAEVVVAETEEAESLHDISWRSKVVDTSTIWQKRHHHKGA
jgi:hypothetical protein